MSETVYPLSELETHFTNERGKIVDLNIALYPSIAGQHEFVIIKGEARSHEVDPSEHKEFHHTWTRKEAEELRDALNLVLSQNYIDVWTKANGKSTLPMPAHPIR